MHSRFRLLALRTMVATVRQYKALASASRAMLDCADKWEDQSRPHLHMNQFMESEGNAYHVGVAHGFDQLAANVVRAHRQAAE